MTSADTPRRMVALRRIVAAFALGLAFSLGVYLLIETTRPVALVGWTFLLLLPAIVTAFIAYVGDPLAERSRGFYIGTVPFTLMILVIIASAIFLREGVICILMLTPAWLGSSVIGGALMWKCRKRASEPLEATFNASALLVLPLVALQVEPMIPLPQDHYTVTRSIVIDAPTETVWRLARGIGTVRADEGRFTVSQSLIGLPRPVSAHLHGRGLGAVRQVEWHDDIRFREVITDWAPRQRIAWAFRFDDEAMDGWAMQDRHLMPDSPHYRITDGGYTLQSLTGGRTRLTLTTNYWAQTPVNPYAWAWGELLIGDVSDNVLSIIRDRAEARQGL